MYQSNLGWSGGWEGGCIKSGRACVIVFFNQPCVLYYITVTLSTNWAPGGSQKGSIKLDLSARPPRLLPKCLHCVRNRYEVLRDSRFLF